MSHLSSFALDDLASGQPGDTRALAHLESCARCRDDLEATRGARSQFARVVFPRTVGRLRPRRRWWPIVSISAVTAIAVMLWLGHRDVAPVDDIAIKGGPTFRIFAKRGDSVFAVHDATQLAPGDQIRFVAGSHGSAYLLVASIDGAATATIYYPFSGERSGAVSREPSELPDSIVLDRAPGPERVFALFSNEPIDAEAVKRVLREIGARGAAAIRQARSLDVPAVQASVVFEKVTP
ncbi:MAG: hypothetical protein JWO36_7489 [Myxococcales bacterium]|nr:hypothetical protein [Myxococcales bacterium]